MPRKELLKICMDMSRKEKKIKEFKRRIRVKGKITRKSFNKNGNLKLRIEKDDDAYNFVVIKSHKEKCALAESLSEGDYASAQGKLVFRAIICTQLKKIRKPGRQVCLESFNT